MDKNEELKHIKIIEEIIEKFILKNGFQREVFKDHRKSVYLSDKANEVKEEIKKFSDSKVKKKVVFLDKKYVDKEFYISTKLFIEKKNLKSEFKFSEKDKDIIEVIITRNENKKIKKEKYNETLLGQTGIIVIDLI